jgi:hypothetical protein
MKQASVLFFLLIVSEMVTAQKANNGIDNNLGNIFQLSNAKSRSISPENFNGAKGKGGMATSGTGLRASGDLGQGWKISPSVVIKSKTTSSISG